MILILCSRMNLDPKFQILQNKLYSQLDTARLDVWYDEYCPVALVKLSAELSAWAVATRIDTFFTTAEADTYLAGCGIREVDACDMAVVAPRSWSRRISLHTSFTIFLLISCESCFDLQSVARTAVPYALPRDTTFSCGECVVVLLILVTSLIPEKYALSHHWRAAEARLSFRYECS